MVAGQITVGRNLPYSFVVTITQGGSAYNLTGKTVWFTVKRKLDTDMTNSSALIAKTITSHTNAAGGVTTISLVGSDTQNLDVGTYLYDLQVGTGASDRLWSGNGQFTVEAPTRN